MAKAKKPKHVAIAGNIGAGKTTLTEMLSKHYRWIPQFEDVDRNPYLMDFYDDMTRWSFNLQIYFLHGRLNQILEIQKGTETVIQDRTIYEDANIFAPNLHEMGLMSKRDFDNYFGFFSTIKTMIQPPDLLIYLKASVPTLVSQIQKRGREYEENIRLDYLKKLNVKVIIFDECDYGSGKNSVFNKNLFKLIKENNEAKNMFLKLRT